MALTCSFCQRVRKVTELANGNLKDERIYLSGFEIYRQHSGANAGLFRESLHIMDDKQRIALVETRNNVNDGTMKKMVRYQFSNHLGSASLELDDQAKIISYEEYTPYGDTSYQAVRSQTETPKRYRYSSKERDEESGLYYYGARYYTPWLGRWISCDPAGTQDSLQLYQFVRDNPIKLVDPSGSASTLSDAFLEGAGKRVGETAESIAKGLILNAATGGIYGLYMMASSVTEAYHEAGGGWSGALNAVNSLNPVNTLFTQGWLANEEAGAALYLSSLGDTAAAQAHAMKSGAAFTDYSRGAVELGMTVAGGVKLARNLGVPGTSKPPAIASAASKQSTPKSSPDVKSMAPKSTKPNTGTPKSKGQILKEIKKKHDDTADKIVSELKKLGVEARHAGNETIKDIKGKSIKGTEGTATTRKPDVVAATDVHNTGIEVKTSESPATVQKAVDQLANEASFEGKGFFDDKPWTIGSGSGVVYTPYGLLHILQANLSRN